MFKVARTPSLDNEMVLMQESPPPSYIGTPLIDLIFSLTHRGAHLTQHKESHHMLNGSDSEHCPHNPAHLYSIQVFRAGQVSLIELLTLICSSLPITEGRRKHTGPVLNEEARHW